MNWVLGIYHKCKSLKLYAKIGWLEKNSGGQVHRVHVPGARKGHICHNLHKQAEE